MGTVTYSKIKKMSPQILVADIDRSIEFYTKKLGFDLDFKYEDFYAGIIKDGYSIHLKLGNPLTEERKKKEKTNTLILSFQLKMLKIYTMNL